MNDPGLHEPIAAGAEQVENKYEDSDSDTMDEEQREASFVLPTRWWYASTAFPLLAGTFGPMANTFSVCALVQYWRVEIPPGQTEANGIDIKDPKWLLAVNAVSLVLALVANVSLLLNMARRLSFSVAQPITILGFWSASVLLIALIAFATHDFHAPGVENQALTQAFYYAIFAAVLYQLISYLMCLTVWGAYTGRYTKEFKLTIPQRTLMLQTISFMVYLLVGAAIYSHVEGWKYLDAIYWADFTCLTVGIGDYAPTTRLGRGLLFPYALGGIVTLGLVVGSIRSMVLDRGKKKLFARMTEKTRRSVLKRVNGMENKATKARICGLIHRNLGTLALDPTSCTVSEKERRRAEFEAMRAVQDLAARKRRWISLGFSAGVFVGLWVIGALVFYKAEKNQSWTYFGSLYFAYTSLLTIGYGDLSPASNSGKPFFVFWSLLAVPSLTILISDMGDTVVKIIKEFTIYLGEITVLPSDEGGLKDRWKYGIHKVTGGKLGNEATSQMGNDMEKKIPMMTNMTVQARQHGLNQKDVEAVQHTADKLEKTENHEEEEAEHRGDKIAEEQHHYRRLLISEIKSMYSYVKAAPPKKFTYDEWAYYLRLLGEDEQDQRFHRRAPVKVKARATKSKPANLSSSSNQDDARNEAENSSEARDHRSATDEHGIREWSWLGDRSPLMGDKDEAEWILEKLLVVLDRELREQASSQKQQHPPRHPQHQQCPNQDHAQKAHRDTRESSSPSLSSG